MAEQKPLRIGTTVPIQQFETTDTIPPGNLINGVPAGGTAAQVLAKIDGTDYNTEWVDQTGGGGGSSDALGTGFTSGGGSGTIPDGTVVTLDGDFTFSGPVGFDGGDGSEAKHVLLTSTDAFGGLMELYGTDEGSVLLQYNNSGSGVTSSVAFSSFDVIYKATDGVNTRYLQITPTGFNFSDGSTLRPYKVYTALLTQSGTDAPVATVLENTLGGDVVWSYDVSGSYYGDLTGAFPSGKTIVLVNGGISCRPSNGIFVTANRNSTNNVQVFSEGVNDTGFDDILNETSIEIRVYP